MDDFGLPACIEGRRRQKQQVHGAQCLVDVERRISLPTLFDVELPAHARQRGTNETVIHLLRDCCAAARSKDLPSRLKRRQLKPLLLDALRRPVDRDTRRPLQARDIIPAEWLLLRSPIPEILAQLAQAFWLWPDKLAAD